MKDTPLTVGSPQQVLERTLTFREYAGHYQRQLFLVDHAGLPLKTVLEQLDLLGEILPELREGLRRGSAGARPGRADPRVPRRPEVGGVLGMKRIVVIAAGLSVPSSTRLLADQLGDAVERAVEARGAEVEVRDRRAPCRSRTRWPTTC